MTALDHAYGKAGGGRTTRIRRRAARVACAAVAAVGLSAAVSVPAASAAFNLTIDSFQEDGLTVGAVGNYEVRSFNLGPDTATGRITVTDTLPTGFTLASYSGSGWSCGPQSGRQVVCTTDQDLPQYTATESLILGVVAPQPGEFTNLATLEAEGENDPLYNESEAATVVYPADVDHPVPTVTCSSDSDIFNTGYNAATGGKLPWLSRDGNWEVTGRQAVPTPPLATSMPPAGVTWRDAFVNNLAPGAWTESPFNNADWISRERYDNPRSGTSNSGDYYYRYHFTLDGEVDPSTFAVQLDFHADNTVFEVYVNGVPQSSKTIGLPQNATNPYNHTGFRAANRAQTTLNDDWRTGANEIVVHIKTSAPSEGFLVQARPAGVCDADLSVDVAAPSEVTGGSQITWDLTVRNNGPGASERWVLRDDVPAGVTSVSTDTPGCAVTGNRVECVGTKLPPGGERTITITGTAPPGPSAVVNTASVTGTEHDPTPTNNTDTATTDVTDLPAPKPDLAIAKRHEGDLVTGQPGSYEIEVTNVGADPATETITVTDTLPQGFDYNGHSGEGWECERRAGYESAVFCTTEQDLAPGQSATLTLEVVASSAGSYTNVASVETEGDVNDDNDTAYDPTEVQLAPAPDLTIDVSHEGDFVAGDPASYEIDVTNVGEAPAGEEIAVTTTLPEGFTFLGHAGEGWNCVQSGRDVVCFTDADLAPGQSKRLTLDVVAAQPGTFVTDASVQTGGDSNDDNDADADPTTVVAPAPEPDLAIDVSHDGDFVAGEPASYEVDVTNVGEDPATAAITVTDTLPEGFTVTGHGGEGWTCQPQAGRTVTCSTERDLAPGQPAPPLTLDVVAAEPGSYTNAASVDTEGDVNDDNDRASDPTLVVAKRRNGTLTCRGSAVRVGPVSLLSLPLLPVLEPWTANAQNVPCADREARLLRLGHADLGSPVPGVKFEVGVLEASTDAQPDDLAGTSPKAGDSGRADAEVTRVKLQVGALVIGASAARSDAKVTCDAAGRPAYSGSSSVEKLTINGLPYAIAIGAKPVTINLAGAVLRLNHESRTGGEIVRRAIWLSTPLGDVTLAEARAGVQGDPC